MIINIDLKTSIILICRGVAQRERDRLITYRSLDRNQPSRNIFIQNFTLDKEACKLFTG